MNQTKNSSYKFLLSILMTAILAVLASSYLAQAATDSGCGDTRGLACLVKDFFYSPGTALINDSGAGFGLIVATGNVGIGAMEPGAKLDVAGNGGNTRLISGQTGGHTFLSFLNGLVTDARSAWIGFGSNGAIDFTINNEAGGNVLIPNGNVGIGTKDLGTYKLNVNGNVSVSDVYITSVGKWASELYPAYLVGGLHTNIQCSSGGGSVVDDGAGNKMCKFTAASCPVGWAQYNNWSETQNNSANYENETCVDTFSISGPCGTSSATCSSGSHTWQDTAMESVPCNGSQEDYNGSWKYGYKCKGSSYSCSGATNIITRATVLEIGCL